MGQHLGDTVCRLLGHGHHDKYHGKHHDGGQDLHPIGGKRRQLSRSQLRPAAHNNHPRTQEAHQQHAEKGEKLHDGRIQGQQLFHGGEVLPHLLGGRLKLLLLIVLPDKGLHYPDAGNIFLHRIIQGVVALENPLKNGMGLPHDGAERQPQHRDNPHEDQGHPRMNAHAHNHGEHHHEGRADRNADNHLKGVLHSGDIRRHAGHQGGGGKMVNVGEGEFLHPEEHVLPQVFRKAAGGGGRIPSRLDAAEQRQQRHHKENAAVVNHRLHASLVQVIDELRHNKRQNALQNHLPRHVKRREYGGGAVLPDTFQKNLYHKYPFPADYLCADMPRSAGFGASLSIPLIFTKNNVRRLPPPPLHPHLLLL